MSNILNYLNNRIAQDSKLKYVLLSAHDTTITRVLSLLEAPLKTPPPYASNLNFSLYESGVNNYTIKITYNGELVSIPACGGTVCSLQQLQKLINSSNFPDHLIDI